MRPLSITADQARRAFVLLYGIIDEVFPEGERPMATQINLHPTTVREMWSLIEEVRTSEENRHAAL